MSKTGKNNRKAIVLFNLGGPDSIKNVRPFLYNLFSDKLIIRAPAIIRNLIALFISMTRYKSASENYLLMGGKSSLLEETEKQKKLLEEVLKERKKNNFKIFISMRYWYPFVDNVLVDLEEYNPSEIILLPLYPQFSSSTTLSSFNEFDDKIKKYKINSKIRKICCFFDNDNFISSHTKAIINILDKIEDKKNIRILFSAHSIPVKYVESGDPYEWQINKTYNSIISKQEISQFESILCYQSKVGPIKWLSPNTEEEVIRAAKENKTIVVVPIAFVSEHIETLVELDIEYKKIADKYSAKYYRVPTLSDDINFINCLADYIEKAENSKEQVISFGKKKCETQFNNCICKE